MSPTSRRGFTLIELLVVLGIIAVLMGLLIPGIALVKKRAKVAKAREQLAQLQAACALYRDANGIYPAYNSGGLMGTNGQTNAAGLENSLKSVSPDLFRLPNALNDPWGNSFRYRPARVYEFDTGQTASNPIAGENPPNIESYQLWSTGPDGVDQINDGVSGDGDDIANWKTN